MGKGDIKTRKGKITNGSWGKRRQHKTEAAVSAPAPVKPAPTAKAATKPEKAKAPEPAEAV